MLKNTNVEVRPMIPNDFEALRECHLRSFTGTPGETMMTALGIDREDSGTFSRLVCKKAVEEGTSLLAWDRDRDEVVGFCINEPLTTILNFPALGVGDKFRPLFSFLGELDAHCHSELRIPLRKIFHLFNLGVAPDYRRGGLAYELMLSALDLASHQGFEYAVAEVTGRGSQRLVENLGFQKLRTIRYQDFSYDGQFPFAQITDPEACHLVGLAL